MTEWIQISKPTSSTEEKVLHYLRDNLPSNCKTFSNVVINYNAKDYEIDAIVLTPHAIYIVEIKQYGGRISGDAKKWRLSNGHVTENPFLQATTAARAFREKLTGYYPELLRLPVQPCVCLAGDVEPQLSIQDDSYRINHVRWFNGIEDYFTNPSLLRSFAKAVDFLIVTALQEERDAVLRKLPGYRKIAPQQDDNCTYFRADLPISFPDNTKGKYGIILLPLLGMGRVDAATVTSDAIRRWQPQHVILVGIAGGISERGVKLGDILVSDQIVDYELGKITSAGPAIRWEVHHADPRLVGAARSFAGQGWQGLMKTVRPTSGESTCHIGPIASGDKVIAFGKALKRFRDLCPTLIGVEMEAAGVATAGFQSAEPPKFFMIRAVSDLADRRKDSAKVNEWRSYACDAAASYAVALLKTAPIPIAEDDSQMGQGPGQLVRQLDSSYAKIESVIYIGHSPKATVLADRFDYDVFISYSHSDWYWVGQKLLPRLEKNRFRVLIDIRDFEVGSPVVTEIEKAITRSRFTLLVITPKYIDDNWSLFESIMTQSLDPASRERRFMPVILQPTRLPSRLAHITALDFTDKDNEELAWNRLIHSLALGAKKQTSPAEKIQRIGGDIIAPTYSLGRDDELIKLKRWILVEKCKIVTIQGVGGIGKTHLAALVSQELSSKFAVVFWRDLRNAPSPDDVIADVIQFTKNDGQSYSSRYPFHELLDHFIRLIRENSTLIVLDNYETVLESGAYRPGYENYQRVIDEIIRSQNDSSLIIASRETIPGISNKEGRARSLSLIGLDAQTVVRLLGDTGVQGGDQTLLRVAELYGGNPLALNIVAEAIRNTYQGNAEDFLRDEISSGRNIEAVISRAIDKIPTLERDILFWIVNKKGRVSASSLSDAFRSISDFSLLEAVEDLARQSLIDRVGRSEWTTNPIVTEFVNNFLARRAVSDISLDLDGKSGFYVGKSGIISIRVRNQTDMPLRDILLELEDTAVYNVRNDIRQARQIFELKPFESKVLDFAIDVRATGKITLQVKLNSIVYKKHPLEIHAVQDNPYFFGPPIKDKTIFFGREKELQTCLSNISRASGAHTMIIGEQRSGKTSLLIQLQGRLQLPVIPIYVSLSGIEREDNIALQWLLSQIMDGLRERNQVAADLTLPPLQYSTDFIKQLKIVLQNLTSFSPGAKIALLLDEAHIMSQISIKFQEVLREAFNQLISSVRVILACYYDFFESTGNAGSPLQNIFEYVFLRPLDGNDLLHLIVEPASWFGVEYEPAAIDSIRRISGGHPYYCQYLCAKSFGEAQNTNSAAITIAEVSKAEQHVLLSEKERFAMGYWERFSDDELMVLQAILDNKSLPAKSSRGLARLIKKYVLIQSPKGYLFSSGLFETWVRALIQEKQ